MNKKCAMILDVHSRNSVPHPVLSFRANVLFAALWLTAGSMAMPAHADSTGCQEPAPASGGDVKAYIDPETGELVSEPPPGQAQAPDGPASAPEEPVYETETLPDGTVRLDLSDRPAEELRAEVVDGKVVLCHRPGSEPPSD